ncbi:MAG TPA: alpha-amylase family glycosyl hydrolase [Saprospiraceae bacterium]|nr:alpha-amylase family glycosyl hydrolase [Saprospiraceae bacterium]
MHSIYTIFNQKQLPVWLLFTLAVTLFSACKKEEIKFPTIHPGESTYVQYDVPFDQVPATSDIVLYEVNLRAFSAAGNLKGVEARLDSIKNLGVNVVWLMPIYPIGELNAIGSPYAVKDYFKVNPDYGTLEDLRELVKASHQRGMAVMLDWVGNHTAWDNSWIQTKAWYTQDASGSIVSPNTWTDVADLNFSSMAMRKEMIKAMKYWVLEANVDGYRCDYAEGVPNDFWKQAIDTLHSIPNRDILMFAEAGDKSLFSAGFDMTFGWGFYDQLKGVFQNNRPVSELVSAHSAEYANVPSGDQIVRWTTNHDNNATEGTPQTIFNNPQGSMAAFVLTSYMGGVPLLYNGQEVGCPTQLSFFKGGNTKIDWNINAGISAEYKKLLGFRQSSNAVRRGSLETFSANPDVLAFRRTAGSEEVCVLVNVRATAVNYTLPAALANTSWVNALTGESVALGASLSLPAFNYLIIKK